MSETIDVEMEVAVRKYKVDKDKLAKLLREHKGTRTNKEIAQALEKPVTLVEHWFRADKSFAVPEPDIWFKLKNLLGITTTEFDQSITEFEFKESNFDLRNRIYASDISPTLTCGCGNHLHLINENEKSSPQKPDQPTGVFAIDQGGGKSGANFHLDISPTLTCTHGGEPAVSYLASGKEVFGTLQANAGTKQWLGNQEAQSGDYHIIEEKQQLYRECSYANYVPGVCGTLKASGGSYVGGSESLVVKHKPNYVVRRLTPIECARLQGFADNWGVPEPKEDLTDEEYEFWLDVRKTYDYINGKRIKEYTKPQMLTWYNKLHSDSAEYKMWGNGVALPPTLYVMQGIYDVLSDERE